MFVGGVFLSFTPCVYPLLPVIAGYIGINAGGSHLKGLFLSFVYVSGLAIIYAALGLIAVLTGKMFGVISSHSLIFVAVGVVFIIFGLSMFDVFRICLPTWKVPVWFNKKGVFPVLVLGMFSGLVASPCVVPALAAILVYLTTTKNFFYGSILLLVFAYGMGLSLILVATFSTVLLHLPKSGRWMVIVKKICALVLIGMGIYFIFNAIRRL